MRVKEVIGHGGHEEETDGYDNEEDLSRQYSMTKPQ
jgi:hypothetical protein